MACLGLLQKRVSDKIEHDTGLSSIHSYVRRRLYLLDWLLGFGVLTEVGNSDVRDGVAALGMLTSPPGISVYLAQTFHMLLA